MYHRHFRVRSRAFAGQHLRTNQEFDRCAQPSVGRCPVRSGVSGGEHDLRRPTASVAPGFAKPFAADRVPAISQYLAGGHHRAAHLVHPLRQRHAGLHGDSAGHGDDEPAPGQLRAWQGLRVWGRSGRGNILVVTISQTPLVPADAVASTRYVIPCALSRDRRPSRTRSSRGSAAITRWRCIWRTHRGGHSPPDCNAWVAIHRPRISSHWRGWMIVRGWYLPL